MSHLHPKHFTLYSIDHNEKSKAAKSDHLSAYQRFCKAIQPNHIDDLVETPHHD